MTTVSMRLEFLAVAEADEGGDARELLAIAESYSKAIKDELRDFELRHGVEFAVVQRIVQTGVTLDAPARPIFRTAHCEASRHHLCAGRDVRRTRNPGPPCECWHHAVPDEVWQQALSSERDGWLSTRVESARAVS